MLLVMVERIFYVVAKIRGAIPALLATSYGILGE